MPCNTIFLVTVDGKWASWSPWSSCDVTCGKGKLLRQRLCNNPAPQNGGLDCPGKGTEIKKCRMKLCPGKTKRNRIFNINKITFTNIAKNKIILYFVTVVNI